MPKHTGWTFLRAAIADQNGLEQNFLNLVHHATQVTILMQQTMLHSLRLAWHTAERIEDVRDRLDEKDAILVIVNQTLSESPVPLKELKKLQDEFRKNRILDFEVLVNVLHDEFGLSKTYLQEELRNCKELDTYKDFVNSNMNLFAGFKTSSAFKKI